MGRVIYDTLSLEQFLRLPEAKPALEYIDGMVVQKESPKRIHSSLQLDIGAEIRAFARPRHLGRIYPELRCTFGGRSLVPDLSYFRRGKIPRDPDGKQADDIHLPPDLAIEILSPGQTVRNLTLRLNWSLRNGVRLAWLLQPRKERAFVFRPGREVQVVGRSEFLDGEEVIPGFRISLDELLTSIDDD
jgi:Uma2 family endonuclease